MLSERLQILITPVQRRRLEAEARARSVSVGSLVRDAVDGRYGGAPAADRLRALEQIRAMDATLPGDPADLDRLIDQGRSEDAVRGLAPVPGAPACA